MSEVSTEAAEKKPQPVPVITIPPEPPTSTNFIMGNDLWDAGKNSIIKPGWVASLDHYGRPDRPPTGEVRDVLDAPDYYFEGRLSTELGFADRIGALVKRGGKRRSSPRSGSIMRADELVLSKDLRRAVFMRDGDIWRSEYNWNTDEYVNEKQVTQLGLFEGKQLLYWYKNMLYLYGGFSKEKPIVRIDLLSGEVTEMKQNGVFGPRMVRTKKYFTNPSGSIICNPGEELLYCYNAETHSFFRLSIYYETGGFYSDNTLIRTKSTGQNGGFIWLTDTIFVSVNLGLGIVSRVDLANQRIDYLFNVEGSRDNFKNLATLPSGHLIELSRTPRTERGRYNVDQTRRFLLDLTNGKTTPIALSYKIEGTWLDDNTYFYEKKDGGLNEVGAWIYDRSTDQNRRLCGVLPTHNNSISFPALGVIYFGSETGGSGIYRADLAEGGCTKVIDFSDAEENDQLFNVHNYAPHHVKKPPVDLGLGSSSGPAWSASKASPSGAVVAKKQPQSNSSVPATGMERILQETEDLPFEQQEEVKEAYVWSRNSPLFYNFYDTVCIAENFWKVRKDKIGKEMLQVTWQDFAGDGANYKSCVDAAHIVRYSNKRLRDALGGWRDYTEEQWAKLDTCVGNKMLGEFVPEPPTNPRYVDSKFSDFIGECRE